MTVKGGTSQACAACKYQGRKCAVDCPLAPYFPPDQPKQFQNVHRLFGVSNILKILKQLDANQRRKAMRSIICHANIREKYPVNGCLGIIVDLQLQIHHTQQELYAVNAQLAKCRQQQISSPHHPSSQLQLATTISNNSAFPLFQNHDQQQPTDGIPISTHQSFPNANTTNGNGNLNTDNLNPLWVQNAQSQYVVAASQPHEYDEISPFFDNLTIDDRQSFIDSKETYESSSESSLKDTQSIEHVSENELKSVATCLTLTSVN
ncbi:LOB domain-containing protein 27-like [Tasmannia lanceolata]|uniref:LOB domain-containing protein 27-like n=1 Tax=Tasmannia lanceolata TaxID=3420 RepID=UPI00406392A9